MGPFIAMRMTALLDVCGLHRLIRHRHCGREGEYTVFTLINVGTGLTRAKEEEPQQLKSQCLLTATTRTRNGEEFKNGRE